MKSSFNYFMPTRIIFGVGNLKELATTQFLPGKKALIVTSSGPSMKKHGYLNRVLAYLKKNNVESIIFDKIIPNPIDKQVDEGAKVARDNNCDFIIGFGGGSPIDSAKSIAVMAKNPGKYWDYIHGGTGKGKDPKNGALPIVAIPTTAGTGTEADPWTVITKSETNEKIGYGNDSTYPILSIVDPELMLTIPPKLTAYQGMDAFFHSVEGYIATINQPASDLFALEAIKTITQYLPIAVKDGNNIEARTKMAWASTESGIVESLSSCISQHSMEHAISAYYPDVPHGAGLIMLSVPYFSFIVKNNPARFAEMARVMGEDVDALSDKDQPFAFIIALKKLIGKIGMADMKLADFGVKKEDSLKFAKNSFHAMGGLFSITPVKMSEEDVASIFEDCFL